MIDIALIRAQESSELADFLPLQQEAGVELRHVQQLEQLGQPDAIILPGSEDIAGDFDILQQRGLVQAIREHAQARRSLVGICGGMHMLSRQLLDPQHSKYDFAQKDMMGLLALDTHYGEPHLIARLKRVRAPWGCELRGYETHRGRVRGEAPELFWREDGSPIGWGTESLWGCYLHRAFDDNHFRQAFLQSLITHG